MNPLKNNFSSKFYVGTLPRESREKLKPIDTSPPTMAIALVCATTKRCYHWHAFAKKGQHRTLLLRRK